MCGRTANAKSLAGSGTLAFTSTAGVQLPQGLMLLLFSPAPCVDACMEGPALGIVCVVAQRGMVQRRHVDVVARRDEYECKPTTCYLVDGMSCIRLWDEIPRTQHQPVRRLRRIADTICRTLQQMKPIQTLVSKALRAHTGVPSHETFHQLPRPEPVYVTALASY